MDVSRGAWRISPGGDGCAGEIPACAMTYRGSRRLVIRISGVHDEFTPVAPTARKLALSCIDVLCAILGLNKRFRLLVSDP